MFIYVLNLVSPCLGRRIIQRLVKSLVCRCAWKLSDETLWFLRWLECSSFILSEPSANLILAITLFWNFEKSSEFCRKKNDVGSVGIVGEELLSVGSTSWAWMCSPLHNLQGRRLDKPYWFDFNEKHMKSSWRNFSGYFSTRLNLLSQGSFGLGTRYIVNYNVEIVVHGVYNNVVILWIYFY